jgi:hypothetical protein
MPSDSLTLDAAAIAEEAFVLAYPLVVMRRTMLQATAVPAPEPDTMRAPVNALVHGLGTPDTLRVSGWLDLEDEPLVLTVPATHGRYYALWLRDLWTSMFASIGARTTGTMSRAFALLGPGRNGLDMPPELTQIAAPTRTIQLGGCIEAVHESDHEARKRAFDGFGLAPLSQWQHAPAPARPSVAAPADPGSPVEQVERMDAHAFFSEASRLIDDQPPSAECRAALTRLRDLGAWAAPAPDLRASLQRGFQAGLAAIRADAGVAHDAWHVCSQFGQDGADPLQRARAARCGARVEPVEDVFHAQLDSDVDGRPLDGGGRYLLRFAADAPPPVHGFWSLTAGTGEPDDAHSIGDLRGLAADPDGSLSIYIQHRPPARTRRANWLPAPPGEFTVALYLYWPRDEALLCQWSPPPVIRLD